MNTSDPRRLAIRIILIASLGAAIAFAGFVAVRGTEESVDDILRQQREKLSQVDEQEATRVLEALGHSRECFETQRTLWDRFGAVVGAEPIPSIVFSPREVAHCSAEYAVRFAPMVNNEWLIWVLEAPSDYQREVTRTAFNAIRQMVAERGFRLVTVEHFDVEVHESLSSLHFEITIWPERSGEFMAMDTSAFVVLRRTDSAVESVRPPANIELNWKKVLEQTPVE